MGKFNRLSPGGQVAISAPASNASVPLLSVYMPAYNVAPFVTDAMQSILLQTIVDFEFIIVDDGSTDSTLDLIRRTAITDPRIRVITQPNAGVSAASNHAISLARADFLARIDGDDVAHPQRLEKQLRFMTDHPDCVALGAAMMLIDEDGSHLYTMPHIEYGHEKIEAALLNGGWPIAQPSCMYRREAVLAAGGYLNDLSLHEDHDLFLRLAEVGRLENLPETLQYYRQRNTSLVARASGHSHMSVMDDILRRAYARRGLSGRMLPNRKNAAVLSNKERFRKWAWRSLKAGNLHTARKYAWATLWRAPTAPGSWKLLYCAMRGH